MQFWDIVRINYNKLKSSTSVTKVDPGLSCIEAAHLRQKSVGVGFRNGLQWGAGTVHSTRSAGSVESNSQSR